MIIYLNHKLIVLIGDETNYEIVAYSYDNSEPIFIIAGDDHDQMLSDAKSRIDRKCSA